MASVANESKSESSILERPLLKPTYADIVKGKAYPRVNPPNSIIPAPHSLSHFRDDFGPNIQKPTQFKLFSTDLFEVRKTLRKGYGAFAITNIKEETIILAEKPLMKAETMMVYYEFEELSRKQQLEYHSMASWKSLGPEIIAIFKTNCFAITPTVGGIFPRSSRLNHKCYPFSNCTFRYKAADDLLIITARENIRAGTELTISYTRVPSTLPKNYGFKCDCEFCS